MGAIFMRKSSSSGKLGPILASLSSASKSIEQPCTVHVQILRTDLLPCRHQDTIATLFHFVDAKGGGGLGPGEYRLATQFPRRVFAHECDETLANAGLDLRQEVFSLESTSAAQSDM